MTDFDAILAKGGPWQRAEVIGPCLLLQGDCLEVVPILDRVDSLITSPPYNCGKDYGLSKDSLSETDYRLLLSGALSADSRVKVINVGQFVGSRYSRKSLPAIVCEAVSDRPVDEVIWDKGPANGAAWGNYPNSPRIRAQHESILVFGDLTMPNGNGLSWGEWSRLTTSIWKVVPNVDLTIHPAIMPLGIASRCVRLWVDICGVVLDPFMGSGTTGVACVKEGRRFIGIELDPDYFDIACKRVAEAVAQPDLFIKQPAPAPQQEAMNL